MKTIQKLHWFGIREYNQNENTYSIERPEYLSTGLGFTQRKDQKEYYCKLCGFGFPYASLHAIRMHALEIHNNKGEFRLG